MSTIPFLDSQYPFHQGQTPRLEKQLFNWYLNFNINTYHRLLKQRTQNYWLKQGEQKALNLFHLAAKHVPAYRHFLKKNRVKPTSIKTSTDFKRLPIIDKNNYISQYPLEKLCWHGQLETNNMISLSSGSTGKPFFWPRHTFEDIEGAFFLEHALTSLFQIHLNSTLLVNCFSMGNYVAGTYILTSAQLVAQKGYPLTIITPGLNYQEAFNMLTKLSDKFDQIILCGYPPFIKDIIDLGSQSGINFKKLTVKFLLSSEFFSETWRDNLLNSVNNNNPLTDTTNLYGTADATIFGFETPTSILIKKLIHNQPQLHHHLFGSDLTPTLAQYNPLLRYFESINNELTLTAPVGIPLIRYNLKDQGEPLTTSTIQNTLNQHGINLTHQLKRYKVHSTLESLPFVYLTSRSDGAVSFYAITIYPEYIRAGLETKAFRNKLSGKFSLVSTHDKNHNPTLNIHIELDPKVTPTPKLKQSVLKSITDNLRRRCSEYAFLEKSINNKAKPRILLHKKSRSKYFQIGIKQPWIIK